MKFTDEQLIKRFESIKSSRSTLEGHWMELAKYGLPERLGTLIQSAPGSKYDPNIYDSTLMHAVQVSSAGFHAYTTNPESRWIALRCKDVEGGDIREWLSEVEEILFNTFADSNFYDEIPADYQDMFAFGTSHLWEDERLGNRSLISFHCRPVSEIFICLDDDGKIDTAYRYFIMTARQAFQKFGDNAGENVKRLMDAGDTEGNVEFLHIIMPREEHNVMRIDKLNMPIASIWFDYKSKKKISEGGYPEFPLFTTRFSKTSGQVYGSTPAMIALPEAKMVGQMSKTTIKAAQKLVEGVYVLPNDGYIMPFKTTPGAVNMKISGNDEKVEMLPIPDKLPISFEMENQRRAAINSIMFSDLFLMLAQLRNQQRTATEITERVKEGMFILSSVVSCVNRDKLTPAVGRTYNILLRNGKLPTPPPEAQGKEIQVEFVTKFALIQKMLRAGQIREATGTLLEMANVLPEFADLPNVEKIGREIAKAYNLENLLHNEKELRAIWDAKAQAAQQASELAQLEQGSAVVGELAKAGKAGKEAVNVGRAK